MNRTELAQRLRKLASELEPDDSREDIDPGAVLCREAAAAIEELARDAGRYRWWTQNYGASYENESEMKLYALVPHGKYGTKEKFDAAIDAAQAKATGKPEAHLDRRPNLR